MKTARKYLIPAFVAAFALMFAVATPYVIAEGGDYTHAKWGAKYHKMHKAIEVNLEEGKSWAIPLPEDFNKESIKSLKEDVSVSLIDAANAAHSAGVDDVMKASIGIAIDQNGNKGVAWILASMNMDEEAQTATANIFVVDAGDITNTAETTKEFDHSTKYTRHGDYKMSGHKMHGYYADMTPEELEAKRAQYKEMKEAFSTLSEEEQTAIKSHFHSMMKDNTDMSQEDREAKFAKLKAEMQAFMELSLDEKISYLKYFAQSLKNQE